MSVFERHTLDNKVFKEPVFPANTIKVTKTGEPQKPRADMILNLLNKSNADVKRLWNSECGSKKEAKEITDDDIRFCATHLAGKLKNNQVFAWLWHKGISMYNNMKLNGHLPLERNDGPTVLGGVSNLQLAFDAETNGGALTDAALRLGKTTKQLETDHANVALLQSTDPQYAQLLVNLQTKVTSGATAAEICESIIEFADTFDEGGATGDEALTDTALVLRIEKANPDQLQRIRMMISDDYNKEGITKAVYTRYLDLIRQRASDLSSDPTAVPRARGGGAAMMNIVDSELANLVGESNALSGAPPPTRIIPDDTGLPDNHGTGGAPLSLEQRRLQAVGAALPGGSLLVTSPIVDLTGASPLTPPYAQSFTPEVQISPEDMSDKIADVFDKVGKDVFDKVGNHSPRLIGKLLPLCRYDVDNTVKAVSIACKLDDALLALPTITDLLNCDNFREMNGVVVQEAIDALVEGKKTIKLTRKTSDGVAGKDLSQVLKSCESAALGLNTLTDHASSCLCFADNIDEAIRMYEPTVLTNSCDYRHMLLAVRATANLPVEITPRETGLLAKLCKYIPAPP